jgi:hypothetical protein
MVRGAFGDTRCLRDGSRGSVLVLPLAHSLLASTLVLLADIWAVDYVS